MQVLHCFTYVPEISFYFRLRQLPVPELYLVVQTSSLCELQHQVRHIFLLLVVIVRQSDDVWMD